MSSLFVEQISVIDCAVLDPNRGLVGCTWLADVSLSGRLDAQGMLFDFGPAKREIKRHIDAAVDHKLLVATQDPRLDLQQLDPITLEYRPAGQQPLTLRCPAQAVCLLPGDHIDTAAVAQRLAVAVRPALPANVTGVDITLRDEPTHEPTYSYCHGLRQHDGHCQRIAHGHRSRLEIRVDGTRSPAHEQALAADWKDIYIVNRADLLDPAASGRCRFGYDADQGRFELELDAERCVLLDAQTTVENIATHIARHLKQRQPNAEFEVRAYEGAYKGAVARI